MTLLTIKKTYIKQFFERNELKFARKSVESSLPRVLAQREWIFQIRYFWHELLRLWSEKRSCTVNFKINPDLSCQRVVYSVSSFDKSLLVMRMHAETIEKRSNLEKLDRGKEVQGRTSGALRGPREFHQAKIQLNYVLRPILTFLGKKRAKNVQKQFAFFEFT